MENFERKNALIELWSYFIDILAFELGKLCPGVGILFHFFRPGGRSFARKSCPRGGDFAKKNSGPAVSPRGMVTGQIDTVLYRFGSYPVLVMGVVPSLMGNVCVYVCSGQSEEAGGGHEHHEHRGVIVRGVIVLEPECRHRTVSLFLFINNYRIQCTTTVK